MATEEELETALRQPDFQLAVLDYYFAGTHGLALMQRLRKASPRLPVVFFCGPLEASLEQRIFEAGPEDLLHKNSNGFLLLPKVVKRHLARSRLSQRTEDLSLAGVRRLMDRAMLGLFRADRTGRLLDASPALVEMLEAESVQQLRELGYDWRVPGAKLSEEDSAGSGDAPQAYEARLRTGGGNHRWFWVALDRSRGANEAATVVGSMTDVTDLRRSRQRASQLAQELARAREDVARHLQRAERAERRLTEFASLASHGLRDPARRVREYTRLLVEDHAATLDADGQDYLHKAHHEAQQLQGMVDELGHLVASEHEVQLEECDTNWLVEEAVLEIKPLIDEKKALVDWNSLPTVRADGRQLRVVFRELIGNAIKFYRGPETPVVRISASQHDSEIRFFVRDNGAGIEPDQRERIFRSTPEPGEEGTSLGLSICRRIVEKHRGTLWVESEPGQGATFVFALPGAAVAQPSAP